MNGSSGFDSRASLCPGSLKTLRVAGRRLETRNGTAVSIQDSSSHVSGFRSGFRCPAADSVASSKAIEGEKLSRDGVPGRQSPAVPQGRPGDNHAWPAHPPMVHAGSTPARRFRGRHAWPRSGSSSAPASWAGVLPTQHEGCSNVTASRNTQARPKNHDRRRPNHCHTYAGGRLYSADRNRSPG